MARPIFYALACLALVGCAPFRWYQLPVSTADAHSTFTPIAMAANQLGYRYYIQDDRVVVEPDGQSRIAYMFDASNRYAMCITITDKNAPLDVAFAAAKAKADDVFNRAMAQRPVAEPQAVAPPPQPTVQINISH
ncbi:MAG: hypothetical protein JWM53_1088 [bacterium]|nr:hypothetical protein [bacterium]